MVHNKHPYSSLSILLLLFYIIMTTLRGSAEPIRFATFNCHGIKSSISDVRHLCGHHDILFLQETWLFPHDLTVLNTIDPEFLCYGSSAISTTDTFVTGRPFGGIAILWRKSLGQYVTIKTFDDPRLLGVTIVGSDTSIFALNVYMPTAEYDNYDLINDYLGKIQGIVVESSFNHVIIAGDMNSRPDRIEFQWLRELCDDLKLCLTDIRILPDDTFTYVSDSHHTTSWLDHVLMSASLNDVCTDMSVLYELLTSDHRPISFDLCLGDLPRLEKCKIITPSKVNWAKLSASECLAYSGKVDVLLDRVDVPTDALLCKGCKHPHHHAYLTNYYQSINECMLSAAKCHESSVRLNFNVIAGWNDLVADAHRVARADFLHWRRVGKPRYGPDHQLMCQSRARFKYALRACRSQVDCMEADGMARSLWGNDNNKFWKSVQRKWGASAPVATSIEGHSGNEDIADYWKTHYDSLLNSVNNPDHSIQLETKLATLELISSPTIVFSADDFTKYRRKLKGRKATGMDGISPEHLKLASVKLDVHYALLYNALLMHSFLPDSFMPVRIVPIVKCATGDICSSKNYRPVAIATTNSKVFEMAILDKVNSISDLPENNQFGFRSGSSTDQCIFLLKERIRRYVQLEGPVYCCFLDASKAFDRVCHDTLFLRLMDCGVPSSVIRILQFWYSNQLMYVSWNGHSSDSFHIRNGVRQGGILSPAFFNVYVNAFSTELRKLPNVGCFLNTVCINHLIYADDLCLISPSLAGLRKLISVCESTATQLSVNFNPSKSVCMRFVPNHYRDLPDVNVTLNCMPLDFVKETRYLGHIISNNLSDASDMRKAKRAIYSKGNSLVRKFGACSEDVKTVLFRSYMTPIYCSHIWANYTQANFNSVKTAYNCIFRKFFNIHRWESARYNLVLRNLPTINEIIRIHTRSLYGRLSASSNDICADINHMITATTFIGTHFLARFL